MSDPNPYTDQPRARRRYSFWTLLAPAALVVFVMLIFNALGSSCAIKDCKDTTAKSKGADTTKPPKKPVKSRRFYHVTDKDSSMGVIADKVGLSVEELQACNPNVDPNALRPKQVLHVEPKRCKLALKNKPI